MTEAELDGLLAQYQGWTAIKPLVQTVREQATMIAHQRTVIHGLQHTLRTWYTGADLSRQPGETDEGFRTRYLALRNTTIAWLKDGQDGGITWHP